MMREATLATSLVIDFLGFLERQGHPLVDVCRAAGIDPTVVQQPNSRVPAAVMERLWPLAAQLTGDPDVGLHAAESYNPGALSIVGYVVLSCRTAAEALDRLARYAPLLNEGLQVELVEGAGRTTCRFGAVERLDSFLHRDARQVMETLAAGIVVTLRRLATAPLDPIEPPLFQAGTFRGLLQRGSARTGRRRRGKAAWSSSGPRPDHPGPLRFENPAVSGRYRR